MNEESNTEAPQTHEEEWKYPGPSPQKLFDEIDRAVEANKNLWSGKRGFAQSAEKERIRVATAERLQVESEKRLAELAEADGFIEASEIMPPWKEGEDLEVYLNRMTPLQQEILLHRVQQDRARLIAKTAVDRIRAFTSPISERK